MEPAARTKNMTHAALPRSEAFHLRLQVQARARNERQRGTIGLRVRQRSTSISLLLENYQFDLKRICVLDCPFVGEGHKQLFDVKRLMERLVVGEDVQMACTAIRVSYPLTFLFTFSNTYGLRPIASEDSTRGEIVGGVSLRHVYISIRWPPSKGDAITAAPAEPARFYPCIGGGVLRNSLGRGWLLSDPAGILLDEFLYGFDAEVASDYIPSRSYDHPYGDVLLGLNLLPLRCGTE
ncbi:hypothetical protein EVAR_36218_1 [Eumeta japonica]|uniref:Uncharacterized protein n=1 Tax=Eumeta variegata TaxID=151549 RepID=A0A4C1VSF1_EUMVA|nr:hypothetical protein EVAR_36218_1 [Eumeta japonica]